MYSVFVSQLSFFVVFICPCGCLVLLWLICRASEQKHINVTEHLSGSLPRQLDLDLYLGVYAGEALLFAYCRGSEYSCHSMNRPTVLWLWPKAFEAQCNVYVGLSCTGR